uniref:Uncharacterized protein n=1 Tax=Anguilla anguilla TaxID=7936 RepID=A0A0E9SLJ7_ANGAN
MTFRYTLYQLPSGVPFTPQNAEVMPKKKF